MRCFPKEEYLPPGRKEEGQKKSTSFCIKSSLKSQILRYKWRRRRRRRGEAEDAGSSS